MATHIIISAKASQTSKACNCRKKNISIGNVEKNVANIYENRAS